MEKEFIEFFFWCPILGPEFYDSPTNNAAVKGPYCYARKESLYSVVSPKSRKGSVDSNLYDEIRYPMHGHSHHHHHQYPSQHLRGILSNNTLTVPGQEPHRITHM